MTGQSWRENRMKGLFFKSSLPAEAHSSGAERRRSVAHGVSRGFSGAARKSPGGAKENLAQGALSCSSVAPDGAYVLFERCPTAHAVGYDLSPLRGFAKCQLSPGARTPENAQSPVADQEVCSTILTKMRTRCRRLGALFGLTFMGITALMGAPDRGETGAVAREPTPAKGAGHWAFRRPIGVLPPDLDGTQQGTGNPLDRWIEARLRAKGLTHSPEADRRTRLRRITLDLTGLPPTPGELQEFLEDTSPRAWDRVVDRLLASPHYGERWGRHWLDVARYADSKGYVFEEERRYAYSHTYRDWVVNALNRDLPYDEFIVAQIAGDRLTTAEDKSPLAALGFLTLGRRFLNNAPDIIDDRIDVIFRGLQGLTVQCARCHDHKFDPIPTADYYALYGVFSSSEEPGEKPLLGENPNPALRSAFAAEQKKRMTERADFREKKTQEGRRMVRERAADYWLAVHDANSLKEAQEVEALARSRKLDPGLASNWKAKLAEWSKTFHPVMSPWLEFSQLNEAEFTVQSAERSHRYALNADPTNRINPIITTLFTNAPKSMKELAERYGALFVAIEKDWTATLEAVRSPSRPLPGQLIDPAAESIRQLLFAADSPAMISTEVAFRILPTPDQQKRRALQRKIDELEAIHPGAPLRAMALLDKSTPGNSRIFKRGNPGTPGDEAPRQFLSVLAPDRSPFKDGSGRLELARAIASRDNPLTARVFVNRIWAHYFGTPLVATPSDFGVRSDPPSHPELLDWLAVWFMDHGWSQKELHRLIAKSRTYQQTADPTGDAAAANERLDLQNVNLWRMNRKRLDFEAMRDSLLAVAGNLDLTAGGQAVPVFGENSTPRRTLYGYIDRQNLPGLLRAFDFASPDATCSVRFQTSVPQQALYFMNSTFAVAQARELARRVASEGHTETIDRIQRMFALAFQRAADPAELERSVSFIEQPIAIPAVPTAASAGKNGRGESDTPVKAADRDPSGPQEVIKPLNSWEKLAQVLMAANEFVFVD